MSTETTARPGKTRRRSTWRLYQSGFLLVRVRLDGKGRFVIPLSLAVLVQTLESLSDLTWLVGHLFPLSAGLSGLLAAGGNLLDTLRADGPYRLAQVETGAAKVVVDVV